MCFDFCAERKDLILKSLDKNKFRTVKKTSKKNSERFDDGCVLIFVQKEKKEFAISL